MSDKIAKEDITRVNEAGQTVVVVPKGQPIPADVDAAAQDTVPVRQASEPKAKRSSKGK